MVHVVVTLESKQDKQQEVLAILQRGREIALAQEGCEGFEVYQGKDEPYRFLLLEHWSSVEMHQPHFRRNVIEAGILERLAPLLARDVQYGYYESR